MRLGDCEIYLIALSFLSSPAPTIPFHSRSLLQTSEQKQIPQDAAAAPQDTTSSIPAILTRSTPPSIVVHAPFPTRRSQTRSPTQGSYTTPAISLSPVPRTRRSQTTASSPFSPTSSHSPLPNTYSLLDMMLLPVTVPFTLSRVMLTFSVRTFVFGVVFGVTLVRIGSNAVTGALFGRRF